MNGPGETTVTCMTLQEAIEAAMRNADIADRELAPRRVNREALRRSVIDLWMQLHRPTRRQKRTWRARLSRARHVKHRFVMADPTGSWIGVCRGGYVVRTIVAPWLRSATQEGRPS